MVTLFFYVTVKEGKQQDFSALAMRMTKVSRAEDVGCVTYTWHQQQDNPREYVLYEQWNDQEALEAHLIHLQTLMGAAPPGEKLPAVFLDLVESKRTFVYDVIA